MNSKHTFQYLLAAAVLASGLFYVGLNHAAPFSLPAISQEKSTNVHIGFGSTLSDHEILRLLHRYNVRPHAAVMWTAGITATHRTQKVMSADAFLQESRAKTTAMLEKALRGNQVRLQHFLAYTEEQVVAGQELQEEARALLNLRAALAAAHAATVQGVPLTLSMEVSGDAADIERLLMDPMIKTSEQAQLVKGKVIVPHTPKPEAYQAEFVDSQVEAMSARTLYAWIVTLIQTIEQKSM